MEIKRLLLRLGLHPHEVSLYLALLELGAASVADIAKQSRLHRPTVYQFLPRLIERNLVSLTPKGKRKIYSAESPQQLKNVFAQMGNTLEHLLPDLINTYDNRNPRPKMKFFEGEKVVTWLYEDVLATCKKGDVFYRYESPHNYIKNDTHLPPAYFERICRKKEIEKFVITNEKTAKTKPPVIERISKAIPAAYDIFEYDITQIVYNNKVGFIDFNTNTGWIIESATFAKFQRQIFKLLFRKL